MHRIVYPFYASSILVHGARADPVRVAKSHRGIPWLWVAQDVVNHEPILALLV